MAKDKKNVDFHNMVKDHILPILTLDNRWHEILPDDQKTETIRELEQKLNSLLKKQGKLVNDIKEMKKLKRRFIKDIMANMDIGNDVVSKEREKKLGRDKQLISDINGKIDIAMNELGDLPYQIKEVNEILVTESFKVLYKKMSSNEAELKEVADWINRVRNELKEKILLKQDLETKNLSIYTYMHDIVGADVMELFDWHCHKKNSSNNKKR